MKSVANDLLSAIQVAGRLRQIDEASASLRPAPGKWSRKEILGHLIDSAANNHQRFVHAAFAAVLRRKIVDSRIGLRTDFDHGSRLGKN